MSKICVKDEYVKTKQGFESTIGTNHVGHFYLLQKLLKNVEQRGGRVVFVGSGVHNPEEAGGNVGSPATLGDMKGTTQFQCMYIA